LNDELVYRPTTDIVPATPTVAPTPTAIVEPAPEPELTIEDALSDLGEVPDLSYTFDDKPRVIVPDPVEVVVWAKPFREAILLASAVTDEVTLTFLPDRIRVRNLDLSEVSMVDEVLIPTNVRANPEAGASWSKRITVKAAEVLKFVPRLTLKDAHEPLRFVVKGNDLTFEFRNMALEVAGFPPEDRELPLPKLTHTMEATVGLRDVLDFIKKAKGMTDRIGLSLETDVIKTVLETADEEPLDHVLLTAQFEEKRKMTAKVEARDVVERVSGSVNPDTGTYPDGHKPPTPTDPTCAKYDLGRLLLILETAKKVSDTARIKWAKDIPLTIEPAIEDGHLAAVFYLASLMES
jgi:hypothetical protein